MKSADIPWQMVTYKVGKGGGGTLGGELSHYNMDVVDFGVPVLSIHTPYAISSKADIFTGCIRSILRFLGGDAVLTILRQAQDKERQIQDKVNCALPSS